ncbi:2'-5' RNA ligase family protein [Devosia sp. ZB163]|uniref:2'-5' RNA ligase family protein n=1 Tax=Devosia sp. ZB163 TaxID=3025938 RepID=UPI00235E7FA5|nr:2'-5' RNA ligase family protein [Devosia sp. ZB163]MDC9825322.1 2'-5' RNA ligase family protein [Devosia sp. ZB163]
MPRSLDGREGTSMPIQMKLVAVLVVCLGFLAALAGVTQAADNPVTAIDIALEPDATMMKHAEAANAQLREVNPKGYALDASHAPHITMLQRFVNTADLDKVYAAVGDVLAGEQPAGWSLDAYKYDGAVWNGEGLTVILVKPTPELIAFQQKLIDAVAPFTVETGTAAAFFTTPEEPDINQQTIDYVTTYVPESSGDKLAPHVTVGVVPPDYMKKLIAEPFDAFTFSPSALSVYQVGNFGTARKKLNAWEF